MRKFITITAVLSLMAIISASAIADVYVHGYNRGNGTYVQPHYRSDPDGNPNNNWSTFPNVNPHTGETGHNHLSTSDFSNISLQQKPSCLPIYSSDNFGQVFLLRNK